MEGLEHKKTGKSPVYLIAWLIAVSYSIAF